MSVRAILRRKSFHPSAGPAKRKISTTNESPRKPPQLDSALTPNTADARMEAASAAMLRDDHNEARNKKQDQQSLCNILIASGKGNVLRGWRRELDPQGKLEVEYEDFIQAMVRLRWFGSSHLLFANNKDPNILTLEELTSQGIVMQQMMDWIHEKFGSPSEMFKKFGPHLRTGELTREAFTWSAKMHGVTVTDEELQMVYECCDYGDVGTVKEEDILFLESDAKVRAQRLYEMKLGQLNAWKNIAAKEYMAWRGILGSFEGNFSKRSCRHRLAPRPWLAKTFEQIPIVVAHVRAEQRLNSLRRARKARIVFLKHLCKTYGREVRGVRCALSTDGYAFNKQTLGNYCRRHNVEVDVRDLWQALDQDGDGVVRLEDLCVKTALALATFQRWARLNPYLGSCTAIWDSTEATAASRAMSGIGWHSGKMMLVDTFLDVLRRLKWPDLGNSEVRQQVLGALDTHNAGLISRQDLEWLDKWRPAEWAYAEPDSFAWEQVKALLIEIYGHPLAAWRVSLDQDDSNSLSWVEFRDALRRLGYEGNIAGAWRHLDSDLSGTITMREYDAPSAELLRSFKEWVEANYGSMKHCFRMLDTDKSGSISFTELKRACHKSGWDGDVRLLFECLDTDRQRDVRSNSKRTLSIDEVAFLDTWQLEPTEEEMAAEDAVTAWNKKCNEEMVRTAMKITDRLSRDHRRKHSTSGTLDVPLQDRRPSTTPGGSRNTLTPPRAQTPPVEESSSRRSSSAGTLMRPSALALETLPESPSELSKVTQESTWKMPPEPANGSQPPPAAAAPAGGGQTPSPQQPPQQQPGPPGHQGALPPPHQQPPPQQVVLDQLAHPLHGGMEALPSLGRSSTIRSMAGGSPITSRPGSKVGSPSVRVSQQRPGSSTSNHGASLGIFRTKSHMMDSLPSLKRVPGRMMKQASMPALVRVPRSTQGDLSPLSFGRRSEPHRGEPVDWHFSPDGSPRGGNSAFSLPATPPHRSSRSETGLSRPSTRHTIGGDADSRPFTPPELQQQKVTGMGAIAQLAATRHSLPSNHFSAREDGLSSKAPIRAVPRKTLNQDSLGKRNKMLRFDSDAHSRGNEEEMGASSRSSSSSSSALTLADEGEEAHLGGNQLWGQGYMNAVRLTCNKRAANAFLKLAEGGQVTDDQFSAGLADMGHRYENRRWVRQLCSELCNDRSVLDWDDFLSIVTAYEERYYDDFRLRFRRMSSVVEDLGSLRGHRGSGESRASGDHRGSSFRGSGFSLQGEGSISYSQLLELISELPGPNPMPGAVNEQLTQQTGIQDLAGLKSLRITVDQAALVIDTLMHQYSFTQGELTFLKTVFYQCCREGTEELFFDKDTMRQCLLKVALIPHEISRLVEEICSGNAKTHCDLNGFFGIIRDYHEEQFQYLKKIFTRVDAEQKGSIPVGLLPKVWGKLGYETVSPTLLRECAAYYGLEDKQEVTLEDAFLIMQGFGKQSGFLKADQEEVIDAFNRYDTDGSGGISRDELGAVIRWLGYPSTYEQECEIMENFDDDGSGELDRGELFELVQQYSAAEARSVRLFFDDKVQPQDRDGTESEIADEESEDEEGDEEQQAHKKPTTAGPSHLKHGSWLFTSRVTLPVAHLHEMLVSMGHFPMQEQLDNMLKDLGMFVEDSATFWEFNALVIQYRKTAREKLQQNEGFTDKQVEKLKQTFNKHDPHSTGYIAAGNIKDLLHELFPNISRSNEVHKKATQLLRIVDANGDGKLDLQEFLRMMRLYQDQVDSDRYKKETDAADSNGISRSEVKEYRKLFDAMDTESSGTVPIQELLKMFKPLLNPKATTEGSLLGVLQSVDSDKDGMLTFVEFLITVRKVSDEANKLLKNGEQEDSSSGLDNVEAKSPPLQGEAYV